MRLILALLLASIVFTLPATALADGPTAAPAATAGSTIQLNVLMADPAMTTGGYVEVDANAYPLIAPGDLTTYSVSNVNSRLTPTGNSNFTAVGMYSDYAGLVGYSQSVLPVSCPGGSTPTNGGHGCRMIIPNMGSDPLSDHLAMYTIEAGDETGTWTLWVRDGWQGVYHELGSVVTTDPSTITQPSLQVSVNYQGTSYGTLYPQPTLGTMFLGAEGYSTANGKYQDYATGTASIYVSNPLDTLICTGGTLGFVHGMLPDAHTFYAGTLGQMVLSSFCSGTVWPWSYYATAPAAPKAATPQKGHPMPKRQFPRSTAPPDTLTRVNLYPSENPIDQWTVRLGSGPDGAFQSTGDVVLELTSDAERSADAVASWIRANPQWAGAQQFRIFPERRVLELDPTSPYALHLQQAK